VTIAMSFQLGIVEPAVNRAVAATLRCQLSLARRLLRSGEVRHTALVHLQLSSRGRQCATLERIVSTALSDISSVSSRTTWTPMPDDGNCASIEIRALMMRVAGHMSNHGLAIVGEHYSREAAMRDAPTHAGPIAIAVKVGRSARPTGSGKRKRIRKTQLWFSCRGKPEASDC
jgi:hypothetical protein